MDLADRSIYGFSTVEHLRFADVDANGHINNGSFIEMMENARVSYLRRIVRPSGGKGGLPRFRLVIGRIEADFKRQMFYPGTATACARLGRGASAQGRDRPGAVRRRGPVHGDAEGHHGVAERGDAQKHAVRSGRACGARDARRLQGRTTRMSNVAASAT